MSALQGQVNRWFTDNPNATGQQVVAAIQSIGGLNAHAGLADILAARYGVAPNEVQNYYNTYATPPAAAAPTAVASTGLVNNFGNSQAVSNAYLSSLGRPASESEIQWWLSNHSSIGNIQSGIAGSAEAQGRASNAAQPAPAAPVAQPAYFAANPDVAAAFKENSYGLTPEQFAQTHFEKFGVNEQRAAPTAVSAPTSTPKSMPANYDQAYVNQLVREAAQQAGGTLSFTDVSNAAKNLGISPEMVNRALSTGVITGAGTPAYEQIVRDAYASIGRTGIGTAASNIDQAGFDGWVQSLQRGDSTPEAFQRNFQTAVADYLARNPEDKYSTYVTDFLSRTKPAAVSGIVDLYRDVLGRDPDPQGLGDWYRLFGEEISPEERAQFEQSAAAEKYGSVPDSVYSTYKTIYGVEPDAETLAQLKNRFGPTFDANEISQYVADDTSLRDDPRGVVKTLQQQILDQGTTQYWSGEGFGSAEKNAADMARMLATAGITNINQFGVRQVERPGEPLYYDDNGTPTAYSEPRLVSEYYNKETGVALDPRYDRAQGNIFSGTFAGDGSTGYGVQFREDGTPVFYTQFGGSTNTLKQITDDLGPMGQIALAVATGGLSIPQQIAAQAALSLASGGDLKDIAKNIAVSLVMSKIPGSDLIKDGTKYLNSIDPSGVLGNAFKSAAASGTRAALTGKDIGDAILSGAVGGGTAGAIDLMAEGVEGFEKLTNSQQNMVKNAISGVVSGRPLDQVLINAAIQAGREAVKTQKSPSTTKQLSDAGLEEVNLPGGIQTASLDGGAAFRVERGDMLPIFAEDARASNIRPPAGYRVLSRTEQDERLISQGVGDAPSKYETVRPAGSYFDQTLNAWLTPSGAFDAATNVEDYSALFGGDRATLTDADIAAIRGTDVGTGTSDFDLDLGDIFRQPSRPSGGPNFGEMVVTAPRPPAADMGEMVVTAPRPPAADMGEMVITAPRDPVADMGEMVITAPRPPADDLGEIVVTAPREPLPIEPLPEEEFPEMVITSPRETAVAPRPTAPTPAPTVPPSVVQKVARQLGVPATSQIAIDVAEALYGTMEYLDIGEEFKPSERKAKPAATQKQQQQTKMAQGGYLDAALAEEMSVDELLNLLR